MPLTPVALMVVFAPVATVEEGDGDIASEELVVAKSDSWADD